MNRLSRFIPLILLLALAISACASQPAAPAKVRIGTQPWIGYGPWWIALEKGLFEKNGLQVELVDFVEDREVNAAFASGEMDAANLAAHTALKLFAAGLDLRVVLLEDASYEADAILAPASVASIAGLKGKQVAYEEGTTSDLLLNFAQMQNQMSIADISSVFMPASDAGATLIAGQVDVAVTYEPYISAALDQDPNLRLLYTAAERPGLISDVLAVRANLDVGVIARLLKVWDEALAFYQSSPQEAKAIIAKAVGSPPEELQTAFDGVRFYTVAENKAQIQSEFLAVLQDVASVSQAIGLITSQPDLEKIFYTEVYR